MAVVVMAVVVLMVMEHSREEKKAAAVEKKRGGSNSFRESGESGEREGEREKDGGNVLFTFTFHSDCFFVSSAHSAHL